MTHEPRERARAPISVVIPCFRSAETIDRALASVLSQDLAPEELLLVDDGNDAEEKRLLEALATRYAARGVRLLSLLTNQGPAAARNAGWDVGKGDYIAFLDADDSWHPRKLSLQYAYMAERPELALTGHVCREYDPRIAELVSTIRLPTPTRVGVLAQLLANRFSTPSVMLRRNLAQRFDVTQRYAEDYLLWCQLLSAGHELHQLSPPLAWLHNPGRSGQGCRARGDPQGRWPIHRLRAH